MLYPLAMRRRPSDDLFLRWYRKPPMRSMSNGGIALPYPRKLRIGAWVKAVVLHNASMSLARLDGTLVFTKQIN